MPGHGDGVLAGIGDDLIDVTGEGCEHGEGGGDEGRLGVFSGGEECFRACKAEFAHRPSEGVVGEIVDSAGCGGVLG
jgi:hypothetical protein